MDENGSEHVAGKRARVKTGETTTKGPEVKRANGRTTSKRTKRRAVNARGASRTKADKELAPASPPSVRSDFASAAAKEKIKNSAGALEGDVIPSASSPARGDRQEESHPLSITVSKFLHAMDEYREAIFLTIPLALEKREQQYDAARKKIESYGGKDVGDGRIEVRLQTAQAAADMLAAVTEYERLGSFKIIDAMSRSFFIGLFSEFDGFIGELLARIYSAKPELFRGIRRDVALADLIALGSLEAVMKDMLEKEIDSFRRESYIEQFAELERKFEISGLRAFAEWPEFVEMSQRRNLMTHNDGVVSAQYLIVCRREGVVLKDGPAAGDKLELLPIYLARTVFVLSKVAFMLTHTLWKKVFPGEEGKIADSEISIVYDLLSRNRWQSAAEFALFALSAPMARGMNDLARRMLVINAAIGFRQLKKQEKVEELLKAEDWTAAIREFRLAMCVLRGEYGDAAKVMQAIGKSGELITELSYHQWPLFHEFRRTQNFQRAYKKVFGRPFIDRVAEEAKTKAGSVTAGPTTPRK